MSEMFAEGLNNLITIIVMLSLLVIALSVIGYVFIGSGGEVTKELTNPESASLFAKFFMGLRTLFVPVT